MRGKKLARMMVVAMVMVFVLAGAMQAYAGEDWTEYKKTGGGSGSGLGEFYYPWGVAADSEGNIYVADYRNHRIQKLNVLTNTWTSWGKDGGGYGSGLGEFSYPIGVAVDGNGNIYVCDSGNDRIQKYSASTEEWSQLGSSYQYGGNQQPGQVYYPLSVAVDSSGNVYVGEMWDDYEYYEENIAVVLHKYDVSSSTWSSMASGGDGDTLGTFYEVRDISFDTDGNMYVVDSGNSRIQKYTASTQQWSAIGSYGSALGQFNYPSGIDVDENGDIYVSEFSNHRIQKYTASTDTWSEWKKEGGGYGSGLGEFYYPSDVVVTDNAMYVADYYNHRIQKLSLGQQLSAYTVTAESTSTTPTAGANVSVTFTVKDQNEDTYTSFTGAKNVTISGVEAAPNSSYGTFNGTTLTSDAVAGQVVSVTFSEGVAMVNLSLNKADSQTINFSVADVTTPATNSLTIIPTHGTAASMTVTTDVVAPTSNGGQLATQPVVTLKDEYGNVCTSDSATEVTASKKDSGDWTLTGTVAVVAANGVVTFNGLAATNNSAVSDVQLAFNSGDLSEVTSSSMTLPVKRAYSVDAGIDSATPSAGANDLVTLTVKDYDGNTDTEFSGAVNVTVSGYEISAVDTYGSFNGTDLEATPSPIEVTFTHGVGTANLKLYKADEQTITFSVAGVTNPTDSVTVTPVAGTVSSMSISQNITAPASNGGQFAQQPILNLVDEYGNICTNDDSTVVTTTRYGAGSWSLAGTTVATAVNGVVTFEDLSSVNTIQVTSARIAFNATGMTQVLSTSVTLPALQTQAAYVSPLFVVMAGRNFTIGATGVDSITDGVTSSGVTVTNTSTSDGYAVLSGTISETGFQTISLGGYNFVFYVKPALSTSRVTVTFE